MKTLMYVCPICGNVILKLHDSGVVPHCCGQEMELLTPEMHEEPGVSEKHLPDVSLLGESSLRVQVGSTEHPMSPEHLIEFVLLESERGVQIRYLTPESKPHAKFFCGFDRPEGIYAWCSRHGLWGTHHLPPTVKCSTSSHDSTMANGSTTSHCSTTKPDPSCSTAKPSSACSRK